MTGDQARTHIKKHIHKKFGSQVGAAKTFNVSEPFISDVLRNKKPIPDWLLEECGLKKRVVYEKV